MSRRHCGLYVLPPPLPPCALARVLHRTHVRPPPLLLLSRPPAPAVQHAAPAAARRAPRTPHKPQTVPGRPCPARRLVCVWWSNQRPWFDPRRSLIHLGECIVELPLRIGSQSSKVRPRRSGRNNQYRIFELIDAKRRRGRSPLSLHTGAFQKKGWGGARRRPAALSPLGARVPHTRPAGGRPARRSPPTRNTRPRTRRPTSPSRQVNPA